MPKVANVLLVDDDAPVRQALEQLLVRENFKVVAAANGDEALRGLLENAVDVVLLDLNLGRESGWDTLERLKKIEPLLPVIMMTARPDERAPSPGSIAEAVIEKPLDLPMLFQTLDMLTTQTGEADGGGVRHLHARNE